MIKNDNTAKSYCGLDCDGCELKDSCKGCIESGGKPFGTECVLVKCCIDRGQKLCSECGECELKAKAIAEFNALGIEDMENVTDLNTLLGAYINLEYKLPGGQAIKFWDDNRCYLGNQIHKKNSDRCYGLTVDENYLLVCEYGDNGSDAEIIVFKKRMQQ